MVIGDSLLREQGERFRHCPDISVRCYRGAHIENLIKVFTTEFVEQQWEKVDKVLVLIGTNHVQKCEVKYFEKKYHALIQIIRARLGNIKLIVCTIPPRPKDFESLNWKCKEFNYVIRRVAEKAKAVLEPLHRAYMYEGKPKSIYFCDGLHCSYLGTKVITKVIKRHWHSQ